VLPDHGIFGSGINGDKSFTRPDSAMKKSCLFFHGRLRLPVNPDT
jgi:hypothetical protein